MKRVRLIGKKALSCFLSVGLLLTPLGTRCFAEAEIDKEICQEQQEVQEKQQKKEILRQIEKENNVENSMSREACLTIIGLLYLGIYVLHILDKSSNPEEFTKNFFLEPFVWAKSALKFFCSKDGLAYVGFSHIAETLFPDFSGLLESIYLYFGLRKYKES